MTEIFWLKAWFAVSMIGLVWFSWGEWVDSYDPYGDIASRITRALIAAGAGFFTFGLVSAFLFLIGCGLIWFFTA
jgi:hypothetical protein